MLGFARFLIPHLRCGTLGFIGVVIAAHDEMKVRFYEVVAMLLYLIRLFQCISAISLSQYAIGLII